MRAAPGTGRKWDWAILAYLPPAIDLVGAKARGGTHSADPCKEYFLTACTLDPPGPHPRLPPLKPGFSRDTIRGYRRVA